MDSRRRFLARISLIVPPVILLSAGVLFSLRQDKALIEQDARGRAQVLAPELARQCGRNLSEELAAFLQRDAEETSAKSKSPGREDWPQSECLVVDGKIRVPVDYPRLPIPPDWPGELSHDQAQWWRIADQALYRNRDPLAAGKALMALRGYQSTPASAANAEFNLLLLEARRNPTVGMAARFQYLADRYPAVLTRSGAPLADLALLQALHQTHALNEPGLLPGTALRVIKYPSFLTPELLELTGRLASNPGGLRDVMAPIHTLRSFWLRQSKARDLLSVLLYRLPGSSLPSQLWLASEGESFLSLCSPLGAKDSQGGRTTHTAWHVTFVPEKMVADTLRKTLVSSPGQLPAYAAAVVQIGDKGWRISAASETVEPVGGRYDTGIATASGQIAIKPNLSNLAPTQFVFKAATSRVPAGAPGAL